MWCAAAEVGRSYSDRMLDSSGQGVLCICGGWMLEVYRSLGKGEGRNTEILRLTPGLDRWTRDSAVFKLGTRNLGGS